MAFVKIAAAADIPSGAVRAFEYDGEQIAIYNCAGTYYATSNICTHSYAELHEGYFDTDDCSIECPLHGAKFSVETGAVVVLPAFAPLDTYPTKVEGDHIFIEVA